MAPHVRAWQCYEKCSIFETIGIPQYCPFCGSKELYAVDESLTQYENYEREIINEGTNSG